MAIDFPNSPTPGQTFTVGDRTWTWNGTSWKLTSYGVRGLSGIVTSATPPSDTSLLWADTATNSSAGIVPSGGSLGQVLTKNSATNYDAGWASVGSAARPLLTGGAYLSGSGLVLSGLTGNYASAPDSAAVSVTGDLDLRIKLAATDYTPASGQALVCKLVGTGNQRSWDWYVATSGVLVYEWSANGSAVTSAVSTAATGITDGTTKWLRVTHDVDNGAGGNDVIFYTSDDGTTWTKLGNTVTTAGTTSIFDSTAALEIGSLNTGTTPFIGTVYRAQVLNGIGGTTVFDADFSAQTADALAFTESSSNAATVTINTTRYSVGIPDAQFNAVNTQSMSQTQLVYAAFLVAKPIIVDLLQCEVTTGPTSNANIAMGIYRADSDLQPTGGPVVDTGSLSVSTSQTGVFSKQITPVTLQPGLYLTCFNTSLPLTLRRVMGGITALNQVMGSAPTLGLPAVTQTFGSFPNPGTKWNSRIANTTGTYHFVHLRYREAT